MEEEKWINKGHVRAFLVCDKSFLEFDAPFVQWLREEGFKIGDWLVQRTLLKLPVDVYQYHT